MKRINTYKEKKRGGFTLVEMIVVLVILSVLAGIAVPSYLGYVDDNKAKQCETHRKALASRLEEMSAMGAEATLTDADMNSEENGCPAGGTYTLNEKGNTIICDKHGETTVILRNASSVKVDVNNVQTEAPKPTMPPATNTWTPDPETKENISVSLASCSIYVRDTCTMAPTVTPDVPCTFSWSVTSGSEYATIDATSGVVMGVAVGTATVTCTATPVDDSKYVGSSATAQVTVNGKELFVRVSPELLSLEPGAGNTLKANVTATGYMSYTYTWSIGDDTIVSADGVADQSEFSVKGIQDGSTVVTCTVTADDETIVSDSANVLVQSTVSLPDVLIKGSWNRGNTTTNGTPVQLTKIKGVHVPSGGTWSCSDSRVEVGDNGYVVIADDGAGDNYTFLYTTADGQTMELHARMVYEITELYSTHRDDFTMKLGEQESFSAIYQPDYITDGPVRWSCTDENVIQYVPGGTAVNGKRTDMNSDVTVTATDVGDTTLTASVYNEYESWLNETDIWKTFSWKIKVEYKTVTGVTAEQLILQVGDEPQQLQFATIPSEGTDPRVSYKCVSTDNQNCVEFTEDGLVTPKNEGKATIYFDAYLDEKRVAGGSCTVVVIGDPNTLTAIGLSPERIDLIQGRTAKIVTDGTVQEGDISVYPIPSGTSLDGSTYTFRSNDSNIATVDASGLITASTSNTGEVPIYVEARKDDKGYTGTVYVNVLPDPSKLSGIRMEPTKISIIEGQQARIVPAASGNSDAEVKILPQPDTASFEGATYTYQSYNEGVVKVSDDGVLTAGSGNSVVGQTAQIHVTVRQNDKDYYGDVYVIVESDPLKLAGINLKPDEITIMEGQQAEISVYPKFAVGGGTVIYPIPTTASLEGVEFSYTVNNSSISVSQDGVITGESMTNSKQTVTVTATKDGQSFTGHVYVNVTKDPDRLSDFWIDSVSVQEGSTATVVKHLTPEEPDLTDVMFDYKSDDSSVATVSPEGVVTGHKVGNTNIRVSASKNGKVLVGEKTFSVTVKPAPPTKFTVAGKEYGITPWETLKEYIQKKQSGESVGDLPTPAFFLDYSDENNWNVYVLKKNVDLKWDDSFSEATSFNDFYRMNTEAFKWVANKYYGNGASDFPTNFTDWGDQWYKCDAGTMIRRNGKIYIAVDDVPEGPLKNWTEEFFDSYFAEMISLN